MLRGTEEADRNHLFDGHDHATDSGRLHTPLFALSLCRALASPSCFPFEKREETHCVFLRLHRSDCLNCFDKDIFYLPPVGKSVK